jgi:HEAT repeat protein
MNAGAVEPGDLPALRDALTSNDAPTRAAAVLRTPNVAGAEELVVVALSDSAPEVRRAAVQALARFGGARGIRAIMRTASHDPAPAVRAEAVVALGKMVRHRDGADSEVSI